MTSEEIAELFEKHEHQCDRFDLVENKLSDRCDLHAFLLIGKLIGGNRNIIREANHNVIYMGDEGLVDVLTEDLIIELSRCGVSYIEGNDFLHMHIYG